jgi:hypothetical protein
LWRIAARCFERLTGGSLVADFTSGKCQRRERASYECDNGNRHKKTIPDFMLRAHVLVNLPPQKMNLMWMITLFF